MWFATAIRTPRLLCLTRYSATRSTPRRLRFTRVAKVGPQPGAQPRGNGRGKYRVRRQDADREFQLRTRPLPRTSPHGFAPGVPLGHRERTSYRGLRIVLPRFLSIHRSSFRIQRFLENPVISRVKNMQHDNTTLKFAIFPTILPNSTS